MQKQAPSIGRIAVALGFALSCFGLLLFLWITFGGPIPLAPKSYRFTADFSEGISLQKESDVRLGGVSVGKVKDVSLPPSGNTTRATIELQPRYAPISSDAKAILRQKTLLGETYIELTSGTTNTAQSGGVVESPKPSPTAQVGNVDTLVGPHAVNPIPENGHLPNSQVQNQVQIDEIFNALDQPTREAFRSWQQNLAMAGNGRALDLNNAFGNLGPFSADASNVLKVLNDQGTALSQLVNSTGQVFNALSTRDHELGTLIHGNNQTFGALASRDKALATAIKIFPTFNSEARKTLTRLQSFSVNAAPLARDLKPVARNLSPTLRSLRTLAPYAKSLFTNLGPLLSAGAVGLPALAGILRELRPVLQNLDPFLANLNPIIRYTDAYSGNVTDFLANPGAGLADTIPPVGGQPAARHALRQLGYISPESLTINPVRLKSNRGNGYIAPNGIGAPASVAQNELFASHDCNNTGASGGLGSGQITYNPPSPPTPDAAAFPIGAQTSPLAIPGLSAIAPCTITPPSPFGGGPVPYVPADG